VEVRAEAPKGAKAEKEEKAVREDILLAMAEKVATGGMVAKVVVVTTAVRAAKAARVAPAGTAVRVVVKAGKLAGAEKVAKVAGK
jgi:hypothetical protein